VGGLGAVVLVTRSQPGAGATAKRLEARGYGAVVSPVLRIAMHEQPKPALDGVQALIATSAHGVAALGAVPGAAALPLYCLAGASLATAHDHGLGGNIHPVRGDAAALGAKIAVLCDSQNGPLLWARGHHVAHDVGADLATRGFEVRSWQAYEARPARALDKKAVQALRDGAIKAVLVHSARGAQAFAALAAHHELSLDGLVIIAISARASAPFETIKGILVHVAASPAEDAIMQKLEAVLPCSGAAVCPLPAAGERLHKGNANDRDHHG